MGRNDLSSAQLFWYLICGSEIWVHNFLCLEMIMQWEMGNVVNYYKLTPDWDCSFLFPFFFPKKHPHSHSEASAFHEKITFLCLSKFPFIYAKKSRLMPCLLFSWVWISLPEPVKWREEWNLSFLSAWLDTAGNGNMQGGSHFLLCQFNPANSDALQCLNGYCLIPGKALDVSREPRVMSRYSPHS